MKKKFITGALLLALVAMTFLPPTEVGATVCNISAVPLKNGNPITALNPGETFDVAIRINSNFANTGASFIVSWDPAKVECNSYSKGTYYSDYADQHGLGIYWSPNNPQIDNVAGRFPKDTSDVGEVEASVLLTGAEQPDGTVLGVTGEGDIYTLRMTAKAGASGEVSFTLTNVILGSATSTPIDLNPTVSNGQVTISEATNQAPNIISISPISGGNGTSLIITGTNFTNLSGASAVLFGTISAQSYVVASPTQITATVPDLGTANTTVNINITTPGGTATASQLFSYIYASPTPAPTESASPAPTSTPTLSTPSGNPATSATPVNTPAPQQATTKPSSSSTRTTSVPLPTSNPVRTSTSSSTITPKDNLISRSKSGTLVLTDLIDNAGVFQNKLEGEVLYTHNYSARLEIKSGTRAVNKDGVPLQKIEFRSVTDNITSQSGEGGILYAFYLEPGGATFSPPLTLTFQFDPMSLPEGVRADKLGFAYYDFLKNEWVSCDFTLNKQQNRLTANLSHFSLFAITSENSEGIVGLGWNLAGIIIIGELLIGVFLIYIFMRRRRQQTQAWAVSAGVHTLHSAQPDTLTAASQSIDAGIGSATKKQSEPARAVWDDILVPQTRTEYASRKISLEIVGGKIVVPQNGKTMDIEIVNMPDTRVLVSLEHDPEKHPLGLAKIVVISKASEYEKLKERQ